MININVGNLMHVIEQYSDRKREVDFMLDNIQKKIDGIFCEIRKSQSNDERVEYIKELFALQSDICPLIYKHDYPCNNFMKNFIYEFDRQDYESIIYLIDKILDEENFLF